LGFGIEARRWLSSSKNKDAGLGQNGAGNGNTLPLPPLNLRRGSPMSCHILPESVSANSSRRGGERQGTRQNFFFVARGRDENATFFTDRWKEQKERNHETKENT